MLKAVLFDLDNTLIDRDQAFRDCVHAEFADEAARAEIFGLDQQGRGSREALFAGWTRLSGAPMHQDRLGHMLADHLRPDAGLVAALKQLSRRVKLGIVSNGAGGTQRKKFMAAGLATVIRPDRVWISAEVGATKPDPAIFLWAVSVLGESPADCLYVGDRAWEDFEGAHSAGLRARLVTQTLNANRLRALLAEEGLA